jgi:hypothetical protein
MKFASEVTRSGHGWFRLGKVFINFMQLIVITRYLKK